MEPAQPNSFSKLKLFLSANKFWTILFTFFFTSSVSMTTYLLAADSHPSSSKPASENIFPTPTPTPLPQTVITDAPPTPTLTPIPTIIIPADPTATWSAFTSSKYSYSVKYPLGWTAQTTAQTDPKILEYVVFNPVATKAGTLSITLSYGTRTYSEALALDPQTGSTIMVASVSATKKNSKDSNGYKATNVIVPFGFNTIIFNAKDTYLNRFNQMLTTLKLSR